VSQDFWLIYPRLRRAQTTAGWVATDRELGMLAAPDVPSAKLVVVIDDDPMVLEGMSGLLRSWGYQVVTAATEDAALANLAAYGRRPDLIVCDYRLAGGRNGVQAVEQLRDAFEIPALIISGGVAPARAQERRASRYELLQKPVDPTALYATLREALKRGSRQNS
jgi:CheY-like chemotaxis protein